MAEQDDVYVGRTLLEAGRLKREELIECLFDLAQERRGGHGAARPLGVLVVARGKLTQAELNRMLTNRVNPRPGDLTQSQTSDLGIGEVVVAMGAASMQQVNECLLLQRETKVPGLPSKRLGELLVEKGYSTPEQIQRALAYLDKAIYTCRKCGRRVNVAGAVAAGQYACRECGGELTMSVAGSVAVDGTSTKLRPVKPDALPERKPATSMPELPPDAQVHIDRAVRVYLRQKSQVRRSILAEAERFQLELSRYGLWVSFLDIVMRFGGLTWQQAETIRKTDFQSIVRSETWRKQALPGYKVLGKIASGGFAAIFVAEQVFGGRKVALKVLHADRARELQSVARFKHEAALLMRFNHPNIVRGFDLMEEDPLIFLAMELVEGDSLDRLVTEGQALAVRPALSITRQVADALYYMQKEGYIHRDVKPENVLVNREGRAKLCDLGFAIEMRAGAAGKAATTVGTATYMSPEQARGELDLKVGTDIYALGLTLYFMLTRHELFAGQSSGEVLADRFASGVATPDLEQVCAPEDVQALLRKMLHPQREARLGSYPEVLAAIDATSRSIGG